ncbi:hypothetical protein HDV05_004979 [Chytridiales sp. JEL 0842]|nr:hypothetical protein HDV05_004979 [Chytridiales sp. JEL 0842]
MLQNGGSCTVSPGSDPSVQCVSVNQFATCNAGIWTFQSCEPNLSCLECASLTPSTPNNIYCASPAPLPTTNKPRPFITRSGSTLLELTDPFRFISYNIPNLHYLEDRTTGREAPTIFEQSDALRSVGMLGGRVARTYVFSVLEFGDLKEYRHIARFLDSDDRRPPGRWVRITGSKYGMHINEELFVAMDSAISLAAEFGVRLIIPFIDRWQWWGGFIEFAGMFGLQQPDAFFTNSTVKEAFLEVVGYILRRTNTITGIPYKDDPTILFWETGNELTLVNNPASPPSNWTIDVARFIKSIDSNHLVLDGSYGIYGWTNEVLNEPTIDAYSNHYFNIPPPNPGPIQPPVASNWTYAGRIKNEAAFVAGRGKVFVAGEIGLAVVSSLRDAVEWSVGDVNVSGAMLWSLRYKSRDGGVYTKSEGFDFYAYHYPGCNTANPGFGVDEPAITSMMRSNALKILQGPLPQLKALQSSLLTSAPFPPPTLLPPFTLLAGLKWQGSTGASSYTIQKSTVSAEGPWEILARNVSDCVSYGGVLFRDTSGVGGWVRVRGENEFGSSGWSGVVRVD